MERSLWLGTALGAASLALWIVVIALGGALQAGLAPWPGIAVVAMTAAAIALSWGQRSWPVATLLATSGVVGVAYGLAMTQLLTNIEGPRGPVFGVILGIPLLFLGIWKGLEAARA